MEKETFQEFCARILPIVKAGVDGEAVQVRCEVDGEWLNKKECSFTSSLSYRTKPKTHIVNGFEVPMGDTEFEMHERYFYINFAGEEGIDWHYFNDDREDHQLISRSIAFKTEEAAIANAKAMLGIEPYGDDE
jgi:hypothetical protein